MRVPVSPHLLVSGFYTGVVEDREPAEWIAVGLFYFVLLLQKKHFLYKKKNWLPTDFGTGLIKPHHNFSPSAAKVLSMFRRPWTEAAPWLKSGAKNLNVRDMFVE